MARSKIHRSKASKDLEEQLARYRSMRDFKVTTEPRGDRGRHETESAQSPPFLIQKHDATRLHYDFRLGWNGVLKSWAVTKGPSLFPGDKRLAVQVEDHPLEYGNFEGTIPKGQYGGGTVMVWDFGDWEPHGDVDDGLQKGHLKFELHGSKLNGSWALVRMHSKDDRPGKPNWLLIKESDQFARSEADPAITEEAPDSAVSNRTIAQIAQDNDRTWQSKRPQEQPSSLQSPSGNAVSTHRAKLASVPSLKAIPQERFPGFIEPQLARATTAPPGGDQWIHELKLDGYRIQIQIQRSNRSRNGRSHIALLTRKGLDWTRRMPDIVRAAETLSVQSAILDGEAVVLNETGTSSFADLQAAFQDGENVQLNYFAFDLLHLNGHNLRGLTQLQRKAFLSRLLAKSGDDSAIRLSEHFITDGPVIFKKACALGAEGIVSKLASAPYTPGNGNMWLKSKCVQEQEFVIGGFTEPSKGQAGIGAIVVGYYEGAELRYAGRAGTGFTQQSQQALRKRLNKLIQKKMPFADVPNGVSRGIHWVQPKLVAQLAFANWTRDNVLRQASFKGLREDKPAKEVVREVAAPLEDTNSREAAPLKDERRVSSRSASGSPIADLKISHPDKVLDEESGMTKHMLAAYYYSLAGHMLPHVSGRPLSILRCPEGSGRPCFFQKHIGKGLPSGITGIPIPNPKTGASEEYLTLNSPEGLVGLAQLGVLEIHPWGSRNESLEKPDRIIFDLDPDEAISWKTLAASATEFRTRLEAMGLESFLKSTGGKGLHVVIPIRAEHDWAAIKQFSHSIVLEMERKSPNLYVTKMTKAIRKNRIFLDYLRNDRGSTAVAPYSPRARSGAPVAMPLHWKELESNNAPSFHVADFANWQKRLKNDPWSSMAMNTQRLSSLSLRKSKA